MRHSAILLTALALANPMLGAAPETSTAPAQQPASAPTLQVFSRETKLEPASPPASTLPPAKGGGKAQSTRSPYDLLLAIPQSQITYSTAPDGIRKVRLQFAFDAYDLNGKLLGSHSQNVSLDLPVDRFVQFIEAPVFFHEQLAFYPGPLFLRVGVLDSNSNKVGTLEIALTVPKVPGQSPNNQPPPCPPRCPLPTR